MSVVNSIEKTLALMKAASPDLEKQSAAVVFVNREYSGQQEHAPDN